MLSSSKERCPVWPGDFPLCNFIVTLSNSVYPNEWLGLFVIQAHNSTWS